MQSKERFFSPGGILLKVLKNFKDDSLLCIFTAGENPFFPSSESEKNSSLTTTKVSFVPTSEKKHFKNFPVRSAS
jgi:hypothetical protein